MAKQVIASAMVYGEWREMRGMAVPCCEERDGSYYEIYVNPEISAYYKLPADTRRAAGHSFRQVRQFGGWAETMWRGASWDDGHPDRVAKIAEIIAENTATV